MAKRLMISLGVGLILAFGIALLTLRKPTTWHGTHLSPPMTTADFTLRSGDGPVSLSDFRGKAVALFFGYTSCPDVCPTTLLRLSRAVGQLDDADRDRVQVVFISIDPERDTPERTSRYAAAVNPSFVGLSGTPGEIADVAGQFGIFYQKAEGSEATGYLMDHSATITVLNPDGKVELMWSPTVTAEQMAADLEAML